MSPKSNVKASVSGAKHKSKTPSGTLKVDPESEGNSKSDGEVSPMAKSNVRNPVSGRKVEPKATVSNNIHVLILSVSQR
jgi:hypothetical protein